MDGKKLRYNRKPTYKVRPSVKFKNKFNGEIIIGDLINEEEIEGKGFFVIRNNKGSVVKLTREAYYVQK